MIHENLLASSIVPPTALFTLQFASIVQEEDNCNSDNWMELFPHECVSVLGMHLNWENSAMKITRGQISIQIGFALLIVVLCCLPIADAAQKKAVKSGFRSLSLATHDGRRTYLAYIPSSYDAKKSLPLVLMLHGGGGTGRAAIWETGWADKAESEGLVVAFPNAMPPDATLASHFSRNPQLWNDGSGRFFSEQKAVDDVAFINATLDDLINRYAIDRKRIFVTGFSNGASMSFRVGAELSSRIAAIAPVAGACWLESIQLRRPVSMCYITGTADPLNLINGGRPKLANGASDDVRAKAKPPVRTSILKWLSAIGSTSTPAKVSDVNGVRTETYGTDLNGTGVAYITVAELGHTWAGGKSLLPEHMVGKTSNKINATDVIWTFFQQHPMR
ncbi:MAG: PHB depolymerase family esterase [Candidatus Melainabacteria bacterium]|nr:PHB depolymerase family esterase [Candidatus Melainabacteria bacterium]